MPAKKANKVRRRFTIRMRTCETIEDAMDGLLALAALKHGVFVPLDEVKRDMAWLDADLVTGADRGWMESDLSGLGGFEPYDFSGINPDTYGKPVR